MSDYTSNPKSIPQRYFIEGVPFWKAPKIYVVGHTTFRRDALGNFFEDFGYQELSNQLTGTSAENLIEVAGRGCYLSWWPDQKGRSHEDYLENIRESDHGSVVRHASATLLIVGVSRGLTHEMVRHGTGTAISQSSSRYIEPRRLGFAVPPDMRDRGPLQRAFEEHCLASLEAYEQAMTALKSRGLNRKQARGTARELLPIGLSQVITFTFNIQSYRHFLRMRGTPFAGAQIAELATMMVPIAKILWPQLCKDVQATGPLSVSIGREI